MRKTCLNSVIGCVVAALVVGCSSKPSSPKPLPPQAFYAPGEHRVQEDPRHEIDQTQNPSGVTFPKPKQPDPLPPPKVTPATAPSASAKPVAPALGSAATANSVGNTTGQFQLIGSVVARVNGQPIYANKILSLINKPLTQKARELAPEEFRNFAMGLIQNQIQELVNDEVLFAAAQRALNEDDQKLADAITQQWRLQQITLAGGSLEVAKAKSAADGDDFEELVKRQYRKYMIDVYRGKKLMPRVQVTVDDMRKYYDAHKEDEFTEHAAAHFRLLEVDVQKTGTREQALDKIRQKLERARNGEDFAVICAKENDDSLKASKSGDMGWINKGSFAQEKVEEAVWKLQPGQFTDVIDAGKAFYIAKLEEVRPGRTRPFNEQPGGDKLSVQDQIKDKLQRQQLRELSVEFEHKLRQDAIVDTNTTMLGLCVDMAMQKYAVVREVSTR
jgi:parvulin-like peptidyl-prolyl isomerase